MISSREYKNKIMPNWCPGCGDFGIQMAIQTVCAEKQIPFEKLALISGIGCSTGSADIFTAMEPTQPMEEHSLLHRGLNVPTGICR